MASLLSSPFGLAESSTHTQGRTTTTMTCHSERLEETIGRTCGWPVSLDTRSATPTLTSLTVGSARVQQAPLGVVSVVALLVSGITSVCVMGLSFRKDTCEDNAHVLWWWWLCLFRLEQSRSNGPTTPQELGPRIFWTWCRFLWTWLCVRGNMEQICNMSRD